MIITVTLNPAVDRVIVLRELRVGDSNRVTDGQIDPGGKGVNVSRVLREMGAESLATGFVAGSLGKFIEESLKQQGIRTAFIRSSGQTRQNLAIVETCCARHTLLNEAGPVTSPRFFERLQDQLRQQIRRGDWVVLAGSVPPHLPATVYADLIRLTHLVGGKACLDTDGTPLLEGIRARPDLVKPNREELSRLVGRRLLTEDSVLQAAQQLHRQCIGMVVVSLGQQGSIAVDAEGVWRVVPPAVETVSAIGAGDSLVAGLVLALSRGESLADGLRLGTAAGAATALQPGTRLARAADIQRLLPEVILEPMYVAAAA